MPKPKVFRYGRSRKSPCGRPAMPGDAVGVAGPHPGSPRRHSTSHLRGGPIERLVPPTLRRPARSRGTDGAGLTAPAGGLATAADRQPARRRPAVKVPRHRYKWRAIDTPGQPDHRDHDGAAKTPVGVHRSGGTRRQPWWVAAGTVVPDHPLVLHPHADAVADAARQSPVARSRCWPSSWATYQRPSSCRTRTAVGVHKRHSHLVLRPGRTISKSQASSFVRL